VGFLAVLSATMRSKQEWGCRDPWKAFGPL
jgi:hypothetical protein